MATFSDDFSGHATDTVADSANTTTITGWTADFPATSTAFISGTIVEDAGAVGGKVLRLLDTGYGASNKSMRPTDIGALADNTTTEILVGWRIESAGQTTLNAGQHHPGFIRQSTSNLRNKYSVVTELASSVFTHRLAQISNASVGGYVGAGKTVTSTFNLGDFWWTRLQVDGGTTCNWRWRTWKDGDAEPGTWQNADTANTFIRGGYVGFGQDASTTGQHLDIQYFSVGTDGDAAPEPSGGSTQAPRSMHIFNLMRG
jgi:hypothetical protein